MPPATSRPTGVCSYSDRSPGYGSSSGRLEQERRQLVKERATSIAGLRRDTGSRWQDALFSLFSLSAESLEPTLVTFNAAAGVCRPEVGGRAWAWACHLLFGKARHAGLGGPDQAGLNTALSAYSTGRCWAHALELLCRWPLEE
ncbi:unnamed protein product, partial [Polarella glacialis]